MNKIILNNIENSDLEIFHKSKGTIIYKLPDGSLLKTMDYRKILMDRAGINDPLTAFSLSRTSEKLILNSANKTKIDGIIAPNDIIYSNGEFVGYTMNKAPGEDYLSYAFKDKKKLLISLRELCDIYIKIEKIIVRAHEQNIVFPDLMTEGNIFFDKETKQISLIDYDGFQLDGVSLGHTSSELFFESNPILTTSKYFTNSGFKENIDYFSLINSFILNTSVINIAEQQQKKDLNFFRFLFNFIGLSEELKFLEKTAFLYKEGVSNQGIQKELEQIAYKYDLRENNYQPGTFTFVKKIR